MFEERCLTCGNDLHDDGRAYCSDECQVLDTSSPCISSASSAYSSPRLECTVGGDVPALVPSALGCALRGYHDWQSASSSSASSASWSLDTDEEDQDDLLGVTSDADIADSFSESSKAGSVPLRLPLSYARRPSGTNTRSTVPRLHKRSSSGPVSSTEYDEDGDESYPSFQDDNYSKQLIPQSVPEWSAQAFSDDKESTITKSKRNRNRASLPAYFSLLHIGRSSQRFGASKKGSPTVSTSSCQTVIPLTPTLSLAGLTTLPLFKSRGRLSLRGSHGSSSSTRSLSDSDCGDVYSHQLDAQVHPRLRLESRGTTQPFLDMSADPRRGRTAVRRNSSPPPKMEGNSFGHGRRETTAERRGRARLEELDGIGGSSEAPGYGVGRSGLMHRESARATSRIR